MILYSLTVQEISLPPFWNPGSEEVVSTEGAPEITGDISHFSPVQPSFWRRPSRLASHLLFSPIPLYSLGRPTVAMKRRSAYFPGPANQTCPLQHRRNYHLSLPVSLVPSSWDSSLPPSVQPASQHVSFFFVFDKRVPSLSARSIPRSDITPGQSGPISGWNSPSPAMPCVRACARMQCRSTAPLMAPSKTLRDPPPWRSTDRECRSASNHPVSCTSCISCTS